MQLVGTSLREAHIVQLVQQLKALALIRVHDGCNSALEKLPPKVKLISLLYKAKHYREELQSFFFAELGIAGYDVQLLVVIQ